MLGNKICFMCFFWGIKKPQSHRFVINFNFCQPFFVFASNTCKTASICRSHAGGILRVLRDCCLSKISKTVIASIPVNVIYDVCRPNLIDVKPCQTMRVKKTVIKSKHDIPVFHAAPGLIARAALTSRHVPSKLARIGIVINQLFKPLGAYFTVFHATNNIKFDAGCQA